MWFLIGEESIKYLLILTKYSRQFHILSPVAKNVPKILKKAKDSRNIYFGNNLVMKMMDYLVLPLLIKLKTNHVCAESGVFHI